MRMKWSLVLGVVILCSSMVVGANVKDGKSDYKFNVLDFGAIGDGKTDDTPAFQKALDTAAKEGLSATVLVPRNTFNIAGHLNIPDNVTLEGIWEIPTARTEYKGSTLLASEGEGNPNGTPFIMLNNNSVLKGITIFYPRQTATNPPKSYPWTVASGGADNCSIVDVLLVNPYQAVDFGTRVAGRHYIRNLYGQPLYRGIFVDQCYDVGRIENVHFWPFWKYDGGNAPLDKFIAENAEAFVIGKTDWEYMSNCFTIFYSIGYHFIKVNNGPGNVLLTQCGADVGPCAVQVDDCQSHAGISFNNGQFYGRIDIKSTNTGPVRFTGCGFFGNSTSRKDEASIADIAGSGHTSFDNCHFITIDPKDQATTDIRVRSGSVTITDSLWLDNGRNYLVLEPGVHSAIVTGNTFKGKGAIINQCKRTTIIKDNIIDIPQEEPDAIVIDNLDSIESSFKQSCCVTEGKWSTGMGGNDYINSMSWAEKGKGEAKAYFYPMIPKTATYAVYLWYGEDPNHDHATNAQYQIIHAKGKAMKTVNLQQQCGQWVLLGKYPFKASESGYVMVTNLANGNIVADAVKWVPVK